MPAVERVPVDLPPLMRAIERRLDQPLPSDWPSTMTADQLVERLRENGLPAWLHESANDSLLTGKSPVVLPARRASIEENLFYALESYQCDYLITQQGTIVIASEDYLSEHLAQATFDISGFSQDASELLVSLQESVEPDSWEANGGYGRVELLVSRQRQLLVVTQTWRTMRHIKELLNRIAAMSAMPVIPGSPTRITELSAPVEVPEQYAALVGDERLQSDRSFRSFRRGGRGGAGLGGGVF